MFLISQSVVILLVSVKVLKVEMNLHLFHMTSFLRKMIMHESSLKLIADSVS